MTRIYSRIHVYVTVRESNLWGRSMIKSNQIEKQVFTQSPLLTNPEACVWLRLCESDASPDELNKAIRKLHSLVRAKLVRPLAHSKPYVFSIDELLRYVNQATSEFGVPSDTQTEGKGA